MNILKKFIPFISFAILSLGAQGLVFVFNILVANKLNISDYGNYSLVMSVVNLLLLLSCQWHTSMVQYCGSMEYARSGNIKQTNQVRNLLFLICYFIIFVGCFLFRNQLAKYVGGDFFGLIMALVFVKALQEIFTSYLVAVGKRQISAINMLLVQVVGIVLILITKTNGLTVLIIQIVSNLFLVQILPWIKIEDYKPCKIDSDVFEKCIKFAQWQLMGSIAIYIISYGDNYIIKFFLDSKDIAIYNAAYKIFNAVFMASNTITTYYIASLAKAIETKNSKSINNIFWYERIVVFSLCAALHVVLIIFTPQIFRILYQGKYNSSIMIFRILMCASLVRYWTVFEMLYFNSVGKIKVQQVLNVLSAIFKIVFSIVFIKIFGLVGVAYSTLLSTVLVGGVSVVLSEKNIYKLSKR